MADAFPTIWASDPAAEVVIPTAAQIALGFECGQAPRGVFNWLFQQLMSAVNQLSTLDFVPSSRRIDTVDGIGGGGDLTQNRTLQLDYSNLEVIGAIANDDLIAIRQAVDGAHKAITREDLVAGLGGGTGGGITGGANVGTLGIGPFKAVSGSNLQFRNIYGTGGITSVLSGDNITLTLSALNPELTW